MILFIRGINSRVHRNAPLKRKSRPFAANSRKNYTVVRAFKTVTLTTVPLIFYVHSRRYIKRSMVFALRCACGTGRYAFVGNYGLPETTLRCSNPEIELARRALAMRLGRRECRAMQFSRSESPNFGCELIESPLSPRHPETDAHATWVKTARVASVARIRTSGNFANADSTDRSAANTAAEYTSGCRGYVMAI